MTRTVLETANEDGTLLELVSRDDALEVVAGGRVIAASDARGAEGALAELAVEIWRGRDDISVLVGGLGLGHTARAALEQPGVARVDVVEVSPAIIRWQAQHFGALTDDPRLRIHRGELAAFLQAPRIPDQPADGWFVILLDLDEWPRALGRPSNALFYSDEGIRLLAEALRPGGVLGIWTTQRDDDLGRRLHARLQAVSRVTLPVPEGLAYIYRGRRGPRRAS